MTRANCLGPIFLGQSLLPTNFAEDPIYSVTLISWFYSTYNRTLVAAGIRRVKGVRRLGVRVGNWLTAEQGRRLREAGSADTLRGKRNRAMLSMLIGCGLRRAELLSLTMQSIQLREEHWVIADLVGKGGHIRTVPIPL